MCTSTFENNLVLTGKVVDSYILRCITRYIYLGNFLAYAYQKFGGGITPFRYFND